MLTPWSHCTARAPPKYDMSLADHVQVCVDNSTMGRHPCKNPATGRHDYGLGVQSGDTAPDFSLARTDSPETYVRLHELMQSDKMVLLQFGAYT